MWHNPNRPFDIVLISSGGRETRVFGIPFDIVFDMLFDNFGDSPKSSF